jgi:hypothetical protein
MRLPRFVVDKGKNSDTHFFGLAEQIFYKMLKVLLRHCHILKYREDYWKRKTL